MGDDALSGEAGKAIPIDQKVWDQIQSIVTLFPFLSTRQVLGDSTLN